MQYLCIVALLKHGSLCERGKAKSNHNSGSIGNDLTCKGRTSNSMQSI